MNHIQTHWLYVVDFKDFVKVGQTRNMGSRLRLLAHQFNEYQIDIHRSFAWKVPTSFAIALEKILISRCQDITYSMGTHKEIFMPDASERFQSDVRKFFDTFDFDYPVRQLSEHYTVSYNTSSGANISVRRKKEAVK